MISTAKLESTLARVRTELLAARNADGFWEGALSSSPVSTATAVTALAMVARERPRSEISSFKSQIASGLDWLAANVNPDGGWGDVPGSPSTLTATVLVWAAFGSSPRGSDAKYTALVQGAERWLKSNVAANGSDFENSLVAAIQSRHSGDSVFAASAIAACVLGNRLGAQGEAWRQVPSLPFEWAGLPKFLAKRVRLLEASYAAPALLAIGMASYKRVLVGGAVRRYLCNWAQPRIPKLLEQLQPWTGGLEAVLLGSFALMTLADVGEVDHLLAKQTVEFLLESQRKDGSWACDAPAATRVTALALDALAAPGLKLLAGEVQTWILSQQVQAPHPATRVIPGGWSKIGLTGAMPDAVSTAKTLLALWRIRSWVPVPRSEQRQNAAMGGAAWLLAAQNADGGIAPFRASPGTSPLEASAPDTTAITLRAWTSWKPTLPRLSKQLDSAISRALAYLKKTQREDGAWRPAWFASEAAPEHANLTCGTSRVLLALVEPSVAANAETTEMRQRAIKWLVSAQGKDGGWSGSAGGVPSIEETAWALESLAAAGKIESSDAVVRAVERGSEWLITRVETGQWKNPVPAGIYYAGISYADALNPQIAIVAALGRCLAR